MTLGYTITHRGIDLERVDKRGNLSMVDPNAPQHTYYRPGFGLVVSS